uniref:Tubulin-specific chaperone D n=1 Tax=Aceria tosichella TaxID=561515 RepID=A0A6G1SJT4_9ACAR
MDTMDTCTESNRHFVDFDQCLGIINDLQTKLTVNKEGVGSDEQLVRSETERLVDLFKRTIDKYQEQPDLIEPYLAQLIDSLTSHLRDSDQTSSNLYHTSFKFLYQLIKVVGFKSFGRKLPHETDKLPLLVSLLDKEDPEDKTNWQTRYVLTVWLSTVILTPFDLAKFDSDPSSTRMSDRIYFTLAKSLSNHDSCQHVTAYCLAKLFTRSDMMKDDKNLNKFIESALDEVANVKISANSTDDVKLIGYLRTLCYIFKFGTRNDLKKRSEPILAALMKSDIVSINRELVRHLYVKLLQRIGMTLLPKRIATWRYKRGSRILGSTTSADSQSIDVSDEKSKPTSQHTIQDEDIDSQDLFDEEVHAAEILQSILGVLFVEAKNTQTKIRWSAAKGIARVASRLSRERASDVIDNVLSSYFDKDLSNEYAWHGGCLALAEMARQGLILEEKLPEVIEIVGRAILYDKIKGSCAIGAQVREAACYVFWAMSRTYEDHLLAPHITSISINLLCTMLFDRELQCRRAASATFQELVGRQGTFNAEGISILTQLDYQSVGLRQFTYLELATQVATFGSKYYEPFIEHLIEKKLGHWDIKIRRLASDSLSALMLYPSNDFVEVNVMPRLSEMCLQNTDNNCKHGGILGLAKVIQGLVPLAYQFKPELIELVGSMAKKCEKQLKSKQQAPNFIEAITSLIISSELAKFTFPEEILQQWEPLTLQALDSDNADLRNIGSDCLLTLYRYFYGQNKSAKDRLLTILNRSLQSPNESTRCGGLRSLSKLGLALSDSRVMSGNSGSGAASKTTAEQDQQKHEQDQQKQSENEKESQQRTEQLASCFTRTGGEIKVDSDTPDIILMSLTGYIGKETRDKSAGVVFAQAMAEACLALASFIRTLDKSRLVISRQWLRVSFDVLLEKAEDYTFDKRGDIGVVVRRAAVRALQDLCLFLSSIGLDSVLLEDLGQPEKPYENRLTMIVAKILQQCVSYNNSAREQAALAFYQLIKVFKQNDLCVPQLERILDLFEQFEVHGEDGKQDGETFNWRDESMPIFVALLAEPVYNLDLWIGLVPAVGMASDLVTKDSQLALVHDIRQMVANQSLYNMKSIFEGLFTCLDSNKRLATNALKVVDCLVTRSQIDELDGDILLRLVESCWRLQSHSDMKRSLLVSRVMCSMLHFRGQALLNCLKHCMDLLVSSFIEVRIYTAEQMGCVLSCGEIEGKLLDLFGEIQRGGSSVGQETGEIDLQSAKQELDLDGASALLYETDWSEALDKVTPVRDQIYVKCLLNRLD